MQDVYSFTKMFKNFHIWVTVLSAYFLPKTENIVIHPIGESINAPVAIFGKSSLVPWKL